MVLPPAARARRGQDGGTRRRPGAAGSVRQDMGRGCADRHGGLSPGLLAPTRARFPADLPGRRRLSARRLGRNPGVLGGGHLPGVAILFVISMIGLLTGMIYYVREVSMALSSVREEVTDSRFMDLNESIGS